MQSIDQDLKNNRFAQMYLLYGDEDYLKQFYKNRLVNAMGDTQDTMNFSRFEGKDINVSQIIDLAETMPFFKDRRLILIENSGFFKNACDELAEYLKNPAETVSFIFVENEIDRRGKVYKALTSSGRAVELAGLTQEKLISWAAGILKRNNKQVRQSTLERLIMRSGTDMNTLNMELLKLIDYVGDRDVIENSDVDQICTKEVKSQVFDMVDAIADGRQKAALDMYYDLLTLKEPPMRILFLIARQFNLMLQVKALARTTRDNKIIAESTGLKPFIAGKYLQKAASFDYDVLRAAVEECVALEQAVKTGGLNDRLSVELLIIKYSGIKKR